MEKKGVIEVGMTPSEVSHKKADKIEGDHPLCNGETPVPDHVKEAADLFGHGTN